MDGWRNASIILMIIHQCVAYALYVTPVFFMWEKLVHTHHKPLWIRLPSRLPVGHESVAIASPKPPHPLPPPPWPPAHHPLYGVLCAHACTQHHAITRCPPCSAHHRGCCSCAPASWSCVKLLEQFLFLKTGCTSGIPLSRACTVHNGPHHLPLVFLTLLAFCVCSSVCLAHYAPFPFL